MSKLYFEIYIFEQFGLQSGDFDLLLGYSRISETVADIVAIACFSYGTSIELLSDLFIFSVRGRE